jgi:hypothetical protein
VTSYVGCRGRGLPSGEHGKFSGSFTSTDAFLNLIQGKKELEVDVGANEIRNSQKARFMPSTDMEHLRNGLADTPTNKNKHSPSMRRRPVGRHKL